MLGRSGFPSDRTGHDTVGGRVHEQRRATRRSDRDLLERAATRLRQEAIRSGYAGLRHQHVTFALALILEELGRHLPDLDDGVRRQAVRTGRLLLGGSP